jgi:hypothetical protein
LGGIIISCLIILVLVLFAFVLVTVTMGAIDAVGISGRGGVVVLSTDVFTLESGIVLFMYAVRYWRACPGRVRARH